MSAERWLPVVGYGGLYEVSDLGRVRSFRSGRILKTLPNKSGYLRVVLSHDGKKKTHLDHRLVAAAFTGKCPKGLWVDHLNGKKQDNRVTNLEYVTKAENMRRASALGLLATGDRNGTRTCPESMPRGENRPNSRLTESNVREIRRLFADGVTHAEIAECYEVSPATIWQIAVGKTWKSVI